MQEYYAFDPDTGLLEGWLNNELGLEPIQTMQNWVSPLLGTRFATVNNELVMHAPDGSRFLPLRQIYDQLDIAQEATADARARAEAEREKAEAERRAKESALAQAEAERAAKELAFAKLRALGIDPNTL